MKQLYSFLTSVSLLLFLVPLAGYGQGCDNKVTVTAGGLGVRSRPNTTGTTTFDYCPNGGVSAVVLSGATSTPSSTLVWRATTGSTTVIVASTSTTDNRGTYSDITVDPQVNTTYTLTSTAGRNCGGVSDVSVIIAPTLTVSTNVSAVCASGSATLTASGSSTGEYTWSGPGINTTTTTGSLSVSPTVTSTYTVTAPTSCGTSTQQVTVVVKALTISPAAPAVCSGGPITLTASYNGTSVLSYSWVNTANNSQIIGTNATLTVNPTVTSTYRVTALTADCSTLTQLVTVTVGAGTVTTSPAAATICARTPTVLSASSTNPATTYRWVNKAVPGTTLSTTSTVTVEPNSTTTYQVIATTCGSVSATDVVVTVATADYSATSAAPAVCLGSSTTLTASSNISGATYRWYVGTGTTIVSTGAQLTVSPTEPTSYRATITTECGSADRTVSVGVNSQPVASITPASATIGYNKSITLTASSNIAGTIYSWSPAASLTTSASGSSVTTNNLTQTTTFTVVATTAQGCSSTRQVTVNVNQPLPVELVKFDATWTSISPKLSWATASEKNSAYFDIERSLDGVTFQVVGNQPGAGTKLGRTEYQFSDASASELMASTFYYRLHQVDFTGESSYSPVRTVQSKGGKQTLRAEVFPNPYAQEVTVRFMAPATGNATLTIHGLLGRTLFTRTVNVQAGAQKLELPEAASLPSGVYYLTIRQGGQQQVVKLNHR